MRPRKACASCDENANAPMMSLSGALCAHAQLKARLNRKALTGPGAVKRAGRRRPSNEVHWAHRRRARRRR
eukprot:287229-Chlamydomonas_euryale.AAC.11